MPKRSNEFQRLIRHIYEQLSPEGASVRESALVDSEDGSPQREVDVLIDHIVADTSIRIAVECRGRTRKSDVEWIDGLIGKYRGLRVNQIIAVSKSGFSTGAEEKARSNNIELRTLTEALDADWPSTLIRVGMTAIKMDLRPQTFTLATDPPWDQPTPPQRVIGRDGSEGAFNEFFDGLGADVRPLVSQYFSENVGKKARSIAELPGRLEQVVIIQPKESLDLVSATGQRHSLQSMTVRLVTTVSLNDIRVERRLYGRVGVSTGATQAEGGSVFRVTAVQVPGKEIGKPLVEWLPSKGR